MRSLTEPTRQEHLWITGAAGFIGTAVIRSTQRHAPKTRISVIGHGLERVSHQIGAAVCDRVSLQSLDQLKLRSGLPTQVIHLAAGASVRNSVSDPEHDFTQSVESSAHLFRWLGNNAPDARVVLASSAAVYGEHAGPLIDELSSRVPTSPYGWHKKIVEDLARNELQTSGLRVIPARIFSTYGPGLRKQLFWDLSQKIHANGKVVSLGGTGHEMRDWCHVKDVAKILIQLSHSADIFSKPIHPVNVCSGQATTVAVAAQVFCANFVGRGNTPPAIRFSGVASISDPMALVGSTRRLESYGIHIPTAFPYLLDQVASWYEKRASNEACRIHSPVREGMVRRPNLYVQPNLVLPRISTKPRHTNLHSVSYS